MEESRTWLHFLYVEHILPKWIPEAVPVTGLVIILLCGTAIIASKRLKLRNPGKFQMFLELIVTTLDGFVRGMVGDEAKALTPIIGTLFIYILALNLLEVIPGFSSPTDDINAPVALALFAFVLVQYYGFRKQGIKYLLHFVGEPWQLFPLMLPIHIIGELARPLSLSLRLFGNIFGEDMVIAILMLIVMRMLGYFLIPAQFPMVLFSMFTDFVQALVFAALVSVYIALAIEGHEEHPATAK